MGGGEKRRYEGGGSANKRDSARGKEEGGALRVEVGHVCLLGDCIGWLMWEGRGRLMLRLLLQCLCLILGERLARLFLARTIIEMATH